MGESIQQVKNQLNGYWQDLDKDKKKKLFITGVVIILSIIVLSIFLTRTKYEVLYSNLSLADIAQVKTKLEEKGIEYKIASDDPTTILVPQDVKSLAKIELASEGLPESGYSFLDAFSDSSWTMSDYDKKERMKFALQSELASTISEIDGIDKATVYINEKDESGFVLDENQEETTASVFIEKSFGKSLSLETIQAIQNLIASSVNMDPEKVQIVDNEGNFLTSKQNDSEILMNDQFVIKNNLEYKINESIRNFLENVFGEGNVDVRSSVKINFDSEKTNIIEFHPPIEGEDEGLIRSMEEVEEHTIGGIASGVPGTEENISDYAMSENNYETYSSKSSTINFELNQINKEILKAPGQVEDITVAVLVNKQVLQNGIFNEEIQKDIEDLIYAATGLDTKKVAVMAEDFISRDSTSNIFATDSSESMNKYIIFSILAAIIFIVGIIMYRRKKKENIQLEELQRRMEEERAISDETEDLDLEIEKPKLKSQIEKFVDKNPELVAQLLRTWLNE